MEPDEELVPISALQHWIYCPRQAALIHLERQWAENSDTAHGQVVHEKAHHGPDESRQGQRLVRGLPLRSPRHGLQGQADVIAFTPPPGTAPVALRSLLAQRLAGQQIDCSAWQACPIEYKRGRPKPHRADQVQLAAQALCLEDMLGISIHHGELFYAACHRREQVLIDDSLRDLVREAVQGMRLIVSSQQTPAARHDQRCTRCSLKSCCLPEARPSAAQWFEQRLTRSLMQEGP